MLPCGGPGSVKLLRLLTCQSAKANAFADAMAPAKTLADMAAQWERSAGRPAGSAAGGGGHAGGHSGGGSLDGDGYDDEPYSDEEHDAPPTCACCRGDARLGSGPFQLARHKRGGPGGGPGPGHSGAASRSRYPQAAPKRVLSASLREEFQQRLEERLAQDLGLPKSAARQSLQLCQRLLGICWSDDSAAGAGAQGSSQAGDGGAGAAAGGGGSGGGSGALAVAASTQGACLAPLEGGAPPRLAAPCLGRAHQRGGVVFNHSRRLLWLRSWVFARV